MIGLGMGSYFQPLGLPDAVGKLSSLPCLIPLAGGMDYYPAGVVQALDDAVLDITALPGLRQIQAPANYWSISCLTIWPDIIEATLPPVFDALKQARQLSQSSQA